MTRDWTGVGSFRSSSSVKEVQSSVSKPRRFQERVGSFCRLLLLLCLLAESSGEFLGMRKGALDLDMADLSDELEGVVVEKRAVCCSMVLVAAGKATRCLADRRVKAATKPCR